MPGRAVGQLRERRWGAIANRQSAPAQTARLIAHELLGVGRGAGVLPGRALLTALDQVERGRTAVPGALPPEDGPGVTLRDDGDVPGLARRRQRGPVATRAPPQPAQLLGLLPHGELGVLQIRLQAVHQVLQRLVLGGVLFPGGRLRGDRGGAGRVEGAELRLQLFGGHRRRRKILRRIRESVDRPRLRAMGARAGTPHHRDRRAAANGEVARGNGPMSDGIGGMSIDRGSRQFPHDRCQVTGGVREFAAGRCQLTSGRCTVPRPRAIRRGRMSIDGRSMSIAIRSMRTDMGPRELADGRCQLTPGSCQGRAGTRNSRSRMGLR
jgi:hypothetical protein